MQKQPSSFLRLGLLAMLGGALLSSCSSGGSEIVHVTATDKITGDTVDYDTSVSFTPLTTALTEAPQSADEQAMLAAINAVRKQGGVCTDSVTKKVVAYPSAPPIRFEGHLHKSASNYANLLQSLNYDLSDSPKDHEQGSLIPVNRMLNAGYKPNKNASFAEDIEEGALNSQQLISDWLASPSHCDVFFDPTLIWGSVARSDKPSPLGGYYWVLNVASF